MRNGELRQFVLFTAPTARERKNYVASYDSREDAIKAAEKLKIDTLTRWQVIDNSTSEVVAEDPGT